MQKGLGIEGETGKKYHLSMESPHNGREPKPRKALGGLSGLREWVFRGLDVVTHHCLRLLLLSKGGSVPTPRSSANDIPTIRSCLSLMDKDAPRSSIIPAIFLGVPVFVSPVYNNKLTNLKTTALMGNSHHAFPWLRFFSWQLEFNMVL